MGKIVIFKQKRLDGGVRTGVSIDGYAVLTHFAPGSTDENSALEWFVDVKCEGENLPSTTPNVLSWLYGGEATFRGALQDAANAVEIGIDTDPAPFVYTYSGNIGGAKVAVITNASRRMSCFALAQVLRGMGDDFTSMVHDLEPVAVG